MGKVIVLAFVLSGCGLTFGGDDAISTSGNAKPDAPGAIVYPCSLQDDTCKASYEIASATCDRLVRCGDIVEVERTQCIADEMAVHCTEATCYADGAYPKWEELSDCLFQYNFAYCEEMPRDCHL